MEPRDSKVSTQASDLSWYLRTLEIARPLHLGDYGGLSLKLIWAVFDVATIIVLGSGLYLWPVRWLRLSGE
jgi:uncharacterized iron-regulated membrane protein